jgi:large subunit ribosomal protein L18
MTKKPKVIAYKRKREGKTNYKRRLHLLMGRKPRLVVRPTLKNMIAQLVDFDTKGDKVLVTVHSSSLTKLGWKAGKGNVPAAYLCGYLLGLKGQKAGIKEAVLDIGWKSSTKGNRIYACLKGALDAGLKVNHDKEILPSEDRLKGKHIAEEIASQVESVKKAMVGEK